MVAVDKVNGLLPQSGTITIWGIENETASNVSAFPHDRKEDSKVVII